MAERIGSPASDVTSGRDFTTPSTSPAEPHNTGNGHGIVERVRDRATAQLSSQKDKATEGLGSVASAVRQTTQTLRDQHHDTVAQYVEQAADQIERFSQRLKQKDVTELLDDAQRLARRQPALFVGGAFAIGLVAARFLKSSAPYQHHDTYMSGRHPQSGSYGSTSRRDTWPVAGMPPAPARTGARPSEPFRTTGSGPALGTTSGRGRERL